MDEKRFDDFKDFMTQTFQAFGQRLDKLEAHVGEELQTLKTDFKALPCGSHSTRLATVEERGTMGKFVLTLLVSIVAAIMSVYAALKGNG